MAGGSVAEAKAAAAALLLRGLRELRAGGCFCDAALRSAAGPGATGAAEGLSAHQAVLAAVSRPLRELFCGSERREEPLLAVPPRAREVHLQGLACPSETLAAALDFIYGGATLGSTSTQDLKRLGAALAVPGLCESLPSATGRLTRQLAEELVAGLSELRAQGLLCDVILVGGGRAFAAHRAVLSAASAPLKRYLLDYPCAVAANGGEGWTAASLELDVPGIEHAEALGLVLGHIYADDVEAGAPAPSGAVAQEVLQLALWLELPHLRVVASRWLAVRPGTPQCALGPASLELPRALETAAANRQELELQRIMATQSWRFASPGAVPSTPASGAAAPELLKKQDARLLERLREAFAERPVWLLQPLLKRLPGLGEDAAVGLLPFLAYHWSDGPWQHAYARLGWDPRRQPGEARALQVLAFRDPFFRSAAPDKGGKDHGPTDCNFKLPPSQRLQHYQLIDIKDNFIASMLLSSELLRVCSRATGWLPADVLSAARDALAMRSQRLREKLALAAQQRLGRRDRRSLGPVAKRLRVCAAGG